MSMKTDRKCHLVGPSPLIVRLKTLTHDQAQTPKKRVRYYQILPPYPTMLHQQISLRTQSHLLDHLLQTFIYRSIDRPRQDMDSSISRISSPWLIYPP